MREFNGLMDVESAEATCERMPRAAPRRRQRVDGPSRRQWSSAFLPAVLLTLVIGGAGAFAYGQLLQTPALVDEICHATRIQALCAGEVHENAASMLPGYHLLLAAAARLCGSDSLHALRLLSSLLSGAGLVAFFFAARGLAQEPHLRTLQLFALPVLFPFLFLVYTDACALAFVLTAFMFMRQRRWTAAGIAGFLSVLIRQQNIVWLVCFLLMSYVEVHGWKWHVAAVRLHLRRHLIILLTVAAFCAFVIVNRGVALGDRQAHPVTFDPNNVFLCLFVAWLVFLPWHLANGRRVLSLLRDRRVQAGLVGLLAIYLATFHIRHPYNESPGYFLRNSVMHIVDAKLTLRVLFFAASAHALLSLLSTRMCRPGHVLLFPFSLLVLLPQLLVEPRYYLVPCALFVLLSERRPRWLEWTTLAYFSVLSAVLFWGTATQRFFL